MINMHLFSEKSVQNRGREDSVHLVLFLCVPFPSGMGREDILCILMPRVERLCNVGDMDGGKTLSRPDNQKPL